MVSVARRPLLLIAVIVGGRAIAVGDQVAGAVLAECVYRGPALRSPKTC